MVLCAVICSLPEFVVPNTEHEHEGLFKCADPVYVPNDSAMNRKQSGLCTLLTRFYSLSRKFGLSTCVINLRQRWAEIHCRDEIEGLRTPNPISRGEGVLLVVQAFVSEMLTTAVRFDQKHHKNQCLIKALASSGLCTKR